MTEREKRTTNGAESEEISPSIGENALKSAQKEVRIKVIDRRFWARKHTSPEEIPADETAFDESRLRPTYVQELEKRLEETVQRLQTIAEAYRHLRSDQEGWRRRMERQRDQAVFEFKKKVLLKILELMDNFRLAISSARQNPQGMEAVLAGLEMIYDQMERLLISEGVEKIEPVGETFDPNVAEVVETVPVDREELNHRVLEVVQPGYRLGDQLLRPARVRVGQFVQSSEPRT